MIVFYLIVALAALAFLVDRATATPRARAVRVSQRLDEARRLARTDDRY